MKFAFSKKYRFKCKKCGVCCRTLKNLSLTDSGYEDFIKIVDKSQFEDVREYNITPSIRIHDVSFEGKDCYFLKRIGKKKICGIYDSRFVLCRLFPLAVTALPNGELLVNLCHCNGVSIDRGELVDETFVKKTLKEVNSKNQTYLQKLVADYRFGHNLLFSFFTRLELVDFWAKRYFLNKISQWFIEKSPRRKSVDIRIKALEEVLSKDLRGNLKKLFDKLGLIQPPMILIQDDVRKMATEIENGLETRLHEISKNIELKKQTEVAKTLSQKKVEMLDNGEPKILRLDEKVTFSTPYLNKIKVEVGILFEEKPLSNTAVQLFEEYIAEILSRVDLGGFPMKIPIIVILESLYRFSGKILTHARAYSHKSMKIERAHINDAIIYLDITYALGSIFGRVTQEYYQQTKNVLSTSTNDFQRFSTTKSRFRIQ